MGFRNKKYGENYDLSMSDLFAGFLFIFILLLVFFLVKLQQEKSKPLETRYKLLQEIKKELANKKLHVTHDPLDGVLLLKDSSNCSYFESSQRKLSVCGQKNLEKVKEVFLNIIPCYVDQKQQPQSCNKNKGCPDDEGCLDSILIEGHADPETLARPYRRKNSIENNLHLSVERARTAYNFLLDYKEVPMQGGSGNALYKLKRKGNCKGVNCGKIFGVSGYGSSRPSSENNQNQMRHAPQSLTNRRRNYSDDRRIEVRFITKTPSDILRSLNKNIKVDQPQ